jgi:hypothetical protein
VGNLIFFTGGIFYTEGKSFPAQENPQPFSVELLGFTFSVEFFRVLFGAFRVYFLCGVF